MDRQRRARSCSGAPPDVPQLREGLEKRLLLYALAVGAGLGAATTPSQAKVVFTANSSVIQGNQVFPIDIDNDGTTDFTISGYFYSTFTAYNSLNVQGAGNNGAALGYANSFGKFAAALPARTQVGSADQFVKKAYLTFFHPGTNSKGLFRGVKNRFLGVKFLINGQVHFGWIGFRGVKNTFGGDRALLYGWAYETIPNKPIFTTFFISDDGSSELASAQPVSNPEPTSLALLARGDVALQDWRRRRTVLS